MNLTYKVYENQGKTIIVKKRLTLFATFFFISEDVKSYEKHLYTFVDLLSDFGGLYQTFVLGFFVLIGSNINKTIITAKMIRATQFVYQDDNPLIHNIKPIRFSTREKLGLILQQLIPFRETKDY